MRELTLSDYICSMKAVKGKGDVISRAESVTGKNLQKLRDAGIDTDKFEGMDDKDIMAMYELVQKYKSQFQPEQKGDVGAVISNVKESLPQIRGDMDRVSKMTGVSKEDMKEMAKRLVDQSDKMNYFTKKGVNAGIATLLKNGGYIRKR